jgi:hypothetical protein
MKWWSGPVVRRLLLGLLVSLSLWGCSGGYSDYTRWLSTTVAGCDPARYDQGVCAPRQGKTP